MKKRQAIFLFSKSIPYLLKSPDKGRIQTFKMTPSTFWCVLGVARVALSEITCNLLNDPSR
uniref:Uncharacterized protein n=1 Tax=Romanomermis culicivorax TaxID=13658 RepID=A0A915HF69_ROMCU